MNALTLSSFGSSDVLEYRKVDDPVLKQGEDRVAFADVPFANAELVAVPGEHVIRLPDYISFETAASVLLQGLTAQYLAADSHKIKPGETVLIHAVSGGVGQLLTQVCKLLGARVIGLTSSESKKSVALSLGADFVFLYREDWKSNVLHVCPHGVDVVYDSVGTTMEDSLAVTKVLGTGGFLWNGKLPPPATFRLSEGREAHDFMESRKSTGKVIMLP